MKPLITVLLTGAWLIVGLSNCVSTAGAHEPPLLKDQGRYIQLSGSHDAYGRADQPGERRSTRMPDLLVLDDRRWIVVYSEYPILYSSGDWARIILRRTEDAGETWSTQVVNEQRKDREEYLGNWDMVRLSRLSDGRLVLSTTTRGLEARNLPNRCWLFFSRDDGLTWEGPIDPRIREEAHRKLGFQVDNYSEMSRLAELDGELFVVIHRYQPPIGKTPPGQTPLFVSDVFASGDGGRSWEYRSTVSRPDCGPCEPGVLVRHKTLQLYFRDDQDYGRPMLVYRSQDGARTWQLAYIAKEAPGHQCAVTMLKDGNAAAIYRVNEQQRVGADLWVHSPETFAGRVWHVDRVAGSRHIFDIDGGGIAQLSDGTLLLCYATVQKKDGTRWPDKRVVLLVLPPQAIQGQADTAMPGHQ